jgi:mannose-6-phosphate isomerase-like protein (cupin superfamily)
MVDDLRISVDDANRRLSEVPQAYVELWKRGDVSLEFYAPRGLDPQTPHDRDEVYVIVSGSGIFVRDKERAPFEPGDFLFVAAYVPHRFEDFTEDFTTWVVFFGPPGGY